MLGIVYQNTGFYNRVHNYFQLESQGNLLDGVHI